MSRSIEGTAGTDREALALEVWRRWPKVRRGSKASLTVLSPDPETGGTHLLNLREASAAELHRLASKRGIKNP